MICPECHHLPSDRTADYGATCQCACHDIADAGPELLAACKAMLPQVSESPDKDQRPWVVAAFSAIAKAERR